MNTLDVLREYDKIEDIWNLSQEDMQQPGGSLVISRKLFADKHLVGVDRQYLKFRDPLQTKITELLCNIFGEEWLGKLLIGYLGQKYFYVLDKNIIYIYDIGFNLYDVINGIDDLSMSISFIKTSKNNLYITTEDDCYLYDGTNLIPCEKCYFTMIL